MFKNLFILIIFSQLISCVSTNKKLSYSNGMNVYTVVSNEIPLVALSLNLDAGHLQDPDGLEGLTHIMAQMLVRSTNVKTPKELSTELEVLGAELQTSVDSQSVKFDIEGLSENQDELLALLREVVFQPKFKEENLKFLVSQEKTNIANRASSASAQIGLLVNDYLYKTQKMGRRSTGTLESLDKISLSDIKAQYLKIVQPQIMNLYIMGKFNSLFLEKVKKTFAGVNLGAKEAISQVPPQSLKVLTQPKLVFFHNSGLKQVEVRMAHPSPSFDPASHYKQKLITTIYTMSFLSPLMKEIRVKHGLAYGIDAYFSTNLLGGKFFASSGTRHEKVMELISRTHEIFKEDLESGLNMEEIQFAKAYTKGTFPLRTETPEGLARYLNFIRRYDMPKNYLDTFLSKIDKITPAELNEYFSSTISPESFYFFAYGDKSKVKNLESETKKLGYDLEVIDI